MNVDRLTPEYPEHLNPFSRKRNTLTRSFREIKNVIVRSLTGKERDAPSLRPKQGTELTSRAVLSMPPTTVSAGPPVALPRSRFSQRVNKPDTTRHFNITKNSITGDVAPNPFDDEKKEDEDEKKSNNDKVGDILLSAPKPAARTKHKRKKKKTAPKAPGSVDGAVSSSKWSLTSTESDMSSIGFYSETDMDYIDISVGDNEEIFNLTREIAKFAEDTNNNSIPNNVENDSKRESNENEEGKDGNENQKETSNVDPEEMEVDGQELSTKTIIENGTIGGAVVPLADNEDIVDVESKPVPTVQDEGTQLNLNNSFGMEESVIETRLDEAIESRDNTPVQQVVEYDESIPASPTVKIRKNILTKENLLGSENA